MAEATWVKPNEVFCAKCQTGHVPTIRADGSVGVECDHNLTPDEQKQKSIASRAGDGTAVGQYIDAAAAAAAATATVADAVAERIADKVGASVAAAIVQAIGGAKVGGA